MKIFILIGLLVLKVIIYEKCLMAEERMLKMCYSSNAKILFLRTYKASHSQKKKKSLYITHEESETLEA